MWEYETEANNTAEAETVGHIPQSPAMLKAKDRFLVGLSSLGGVEGGEVVVAINGKGQHFRILLVAADTAVST